MDDSIGVQQADLSANTYPGTLYHTTPQKNIDTILTNGLIPKIPEEWKNLISSDNRNLPIVWLSGIRTSKTNLIIDASRLDNKHLHKIERNDVDWWYYAGTIHPKYIRRDDRYSGKRNDLRNTDEDGIDVPDIADIKKWALWICGEQRGITAYMLAEQAGISKEWARKILNRMHDSGELTCRQFSQVKLFGLPDIPCPHCGEMMSAYTRGSCNRCFEFGGGR